MPSNQSARRRALRPTAFVLILILLGIVSTVYDLPSIASLEAGLDQPSVRLVDRNGRLLYEIIAADGGRNAALSFGNIPQCIKDATIAVEDKNFYRNPGVDLEGILRAIWINLKGGEVVAGGSTITQQVARTLLLSEDERMERTLRRKLREAILAWQLTHRYSKEEILALYLNHVYYGGMAYGIEAASQTYFGKPAEELLLPECALLAGLPQTPGIYNPFTHPDLALERQRVVLGLMQKQEFITDAQRVEAEKSPISYNSEPYPIEAPHFIWVVRDQLDTLLSNGVLHRDQSMVVRTTLDLDMQHIAEGAIAHRLELYKQSRDGISHNVNNAAVLIIDPETGEILAMVGSADFFNASINGALNMSTSARQTGSAFKPIIYAAALDPTLPDPLSAASTLLDVSTTFTTRDGAPYVPVDYDGKEHGFVSVREALASSLNIPAVLTLEHVGIENVLMLAHRLGIQSLSSPRDYDLSLALGGGEMSLLELSTAFATLANKGLYTGNSSILEIRNADGQLLYSPERQTPSQVVDTRVAWLLSDILSDDRARATGFGLNSILNLDRTAAVKTGTTTNFHDNWTIGYTTDLLVGVWVGNSNYEAMHNVTGLTGAAPIWHETMRTVLQGHPDASFDRPDRVSQIEVCDLSGLLPTAQCLHTNTEWFLEEVQPRTYDGFHQQVWIDAWTNRLADDSTPPDRRKPLIVLDIPLEAQSWARSQGYLLLGDYSAQTQNPGLILISPKGNTTFRIDPHFDLSAQQLLVEAISGQEYLHVTLYVDGESLAEFSSSPYQAWWSLLEGNHRVWAEGVSADGGLFKSEEILIEVVE